LLRAAHSPKQPHLTTQHPIYRAQEHSYLLQQVRPIPRQSSSKAKNPLPGPSAPAICPSIVPSLQSCACTFNSSAERWPRERVSMLGKSCIHDQLCCFIRACSCWCGMARNGMVQLMILPTLRCLWLDPRPIRPPVGSELGWKVGRSLSHLSFLLRHRRCSWSGLD
jgi:hypothetical protein